MSWQKLSTRLGTLPLVLAGPILRQVTANAVTVWFALQKPAKVSLRVFETGSPGSSLMATGTAPNGEPAATTPIGKNLHVVAATVRTENALVPGKIYCYDASFTTTDASATTQTLAQAIVAPGATPPAKPLAYDPHDFPSFALPPADLNKLRLVHGSCRKPHGGTLPKDQTPTPDQLSTLDALIATTANDAMGRPHQLLLTGDQIYADDVDDELLVSLTDAGDTLLGWSGDGEVLPSSDPTTHFVKNLAAGTRFQVITGAGFTGDDRRSHLLSLGEFFAMYLFVWSDVLWTDTMPYSQFLDLMNVTLAQHFGQGWTVPDDVKKEYDDRQAAVQNFRKTLPLVRRALANIPTYMILDDHEVTDDFNMTRGFMNGVYNDDLGVRVVQNALTAFSICQAWGNVPEQFDPNTPTAAGTQLLAQLAKVATAADNGGAFFVASDTIMQLVGVHRIQQMIDPNDKTDANKKADPKDKSIHAFHEGAPGDIVTVNGVDVNTKSLRYNFTVEGPAHQILLTDTRTWRGFPFKHNLPTLLYNQLDDQIVNAKPPLDGRLQILVCSTNAPPIASIRMLIHANVMQWGYTQVRSVRDQTPHSAVDYMDVYDSWDFPARDFDEMIVAVTKRLPSTNGTIVAPVVLLSGDVHFSFSSRMAYWATRRLGDDSTPQPAKITIGQLVSSALKNEKDQTRGVQLGGYGNPDPGIGKWLKAAPYILAGVGAGVGALAGKGPEGKLKDAAIGAAAGVLLDLVLIQIVFGRQIPPPIPEAYIGWNIPKDGQDKSIVKPGTASTYPFMVSAAAPTFDHNLNPSELKGVLITPDYRYRLDYLTSVRSNDTSPVTPPPSATSGASAAQWATAYGQAANARTNAVAKGAKLPDCIGHNAIGEINFVWPAGDPSKPIGRLVHHRVHWQTPGATGGPMWHEYDVSLDIDDPKYPDLTKDVAP